LGLHYTWKVTQFNASTSKVSKIDGKNWVRFILVCALYSIKDGKHRR